MKKLPDTAQYFYQREHFCTQVQGTTSRAVFRNAAQPLAEMEHGKSHEPTKLLAMDIQGSVLNVYTDGGLRRLIYTPFGYSEEESGSLSLFGFNAELRNAPTGCYLLGNGYRTYSPTLMRFHSSDSLSPFGSGGLNSYAYCEGDPVNFTDPVGHMRTTRSHLAARNQRPLSPAPLPNTRAENRRDHHETFARARDARFAARRAQGLASQHSNRAQAFRTQGAQSNDPLVTWAAEILANTQNHSASEQTAIAAALGQQAMAESRRLYALERSVQTTFSNRENVIPQLLQAIPPENVEIRQPTLEVQHIRASETIAQADVRSMLISNGMGGISILR